MLRPHITKAILPFFETALLLVGLHITQAQIPQIGAEHPDVVAILNITKPPADIGLPSNAWTDSYSYQGRCYCWTDFDHNIGDIEIDTGRANIGNNGILTLKEACKRIGEGPGPWGNPIYNDVQCGNGPPNNADMMDEIKCPGRVDLGMDGCGMIGPKFDFDAEPYVMPCQDFCKGNGGIWPFGCNPSLSNIGSFKCGATGGCFYDSHYEPIGISLADPNKCVFRNFDANLLAPPKAPSPLSSKPPLPMPQPKSTTQPVPSAPSIGPMPNENPMACDGFCVGNGGVYPYLCNDQLLEPKSFLCNKNNDGCSYLDVVKPVGSIDGDWCVFKGGPPAPKGSSSEKPTASPKNACNGICVGNDGIYPYGCNDGLTWPKSFRCSRNNDGCSYLEVMELPVGTVDGEWCVFKGSSPA